MSGGGPILREGTSAILISTDGRLLGRAHSWQMLAFHSRFASAYESLQKR